MGTEIKKNQVSKRSDVPKKFIGGEILLNLMFRGQYLQDNIGHEIINMFRADDGNNYIYVNPYGTFHKSHSGKIETILLGRYAGDNCIEIIAKAESLEEIVKVGNDDETIASEQRKYCDDNHILYGGKGVIKIFDVNDGAQDQRAWVSFRAKKYRKSRQDQKIFITDTKEREDRSNNIFYIGSPDDNKIRFPKQSLKAYYAKDSETSAAYSALNELIHKEELWEGKNTTTKIIKKDAKDKYGNFLKLIKKENDELSFSNLFAHYFSHRFGLLGSFAKELLGLKITGHYMIEREWKNIDLLIEDDSQIIVIENKIKSKINGMRHDFDGDLVQSQLQKYIEEANNRAEEKKKMTRFFIFSPNYNHIELKTYAGGKKYTPILYSNIYAFFRENTPENPDDYYDDFVKALYKHTRDYADDLYGEMRQKFAAAIFQK